METLKLGKLTIAESIKSRSRVYREAKCSCRGAFGFRLFFKTEIMQVQCASCGSVYQVTEEERH